MTKTRKASAPEAQTAGVVLGIETATALGGVALVSPAGELLGEITMRGNGSHAERVLPAVAVLLETHGLTPRDIVAVAVSRGPGSFTGLRSGIAAAKGLAFSLDVPLYGIGTLAALAANAAPCDGTVCAALNARRGEIFRAFFRAGARGPEPLGEEALVTTESLAGELPAGCLVVGLPADALPGRIASGVRIAPAHLNHPRAAVIAVRGSRALRAGRASELGTLLPCYLRAPDAEPARGPTEIVCADEGLRASSLTPPPPSGSMDAVRTRRRGRER